MTPKEEGTTIKFAGAVCIPEALRKIGIDPVKGKSEGTDHLPDRE